MKAKFHGCRRKILQPAIQPVLVVGLIDLKLKLVIQALSIRLVEQKCLLNPEKALKCGHKTSFSN